jgi:hypothetical protein
MSLHFETNIRFVIWRLKKWDFKYVTSHCHPVTTMEHLLLEKKFVFTKIVLCCDVTGDIGPRSPHLLGSLDYTPDTHSVGFL